jgi:hypothetical protein
MSHKEDGLNDLLKPLKDTSPNDFQMQKWQLAVQREIRKNAQMVTTTKRKWALQLVAAMLVGIIMGAVSYKTLQRPSESSLVAQISSADATFERSHANLD